MHIVGTKIGEKFMEASSPNRDILYNQIEEMYGKVMYSYTTQVIHAGRLYRRNKLLKWGQLIFSAISTGGIIGNLITKCDSFAWIGGIFSTILLVLTAYFKDNEFSNLHQRHLNTSNQLWMIREKYLSLLIDFNELGREDIVNRRDELHLQLSKIYEEAPLTDDKSYALAQKALQENESQFFSRKELNQILPILLRKGEKAK